MDPQEEIGKIRAWLTKQVEESGAVGFVVGLSGGVDSAVVAALASEVTDVQTLWMSGPTSTKEAEGCAYLVADHIGTNLQTVDLTETTETLWNSIYPNRNYRDDENKIILGNMQARLRMTTLYTLANANNLLVLGTGNKSEALIGYFTKYGDGGVDLLPIAHLYKTQVYDLAEHLGIPDEVISRPPSAGLWDGQTDEEEIGLTYDEIDIILVGHKTRISPHLIVLSNNHANGTRINVEDVEGVKTMMEHARHKLKMPPTIE